MLQININSEESYPIITGQGLLGQIGELAQQVSVPGKILVITDENVQSLYGAVIFSSLEMAGFSPISAILPAGEQTKSISQLQALYDLAVEHHLDRGTLVLALGGGVVGDLAGLFAATYLRGLPLIQVPTTLLAQVDSSVGGKVAINHPAGKNLIGTFYHPKMVVIDTETLATLESRELLAGMAEVIKYGVALDAQLFSYLESNWKQALALVPHTIEHLIGHCCQLKAMVVTRDSRDQGLRFILNFGHTIGHAIEAATDYQLYRHGEAVAIGMAMICQIAVEMKELEVCAMKRVLNLLVSCGLPTHISSDVDIEKIIQALSLDKKIRHGKLKMIIPQGIGSVKITDSVPVELIRECLV